LQSRISESGEDQEIQKLFDELMACFKKTDVVSIHNSLEAIVVRRDAFKAFHPQLLSLNDELIMHFRLHSSYIERFNAITMTTGDIQKLTGRDWKNHIFTRKIWLEGTETDVKQASQKLQRAKIPTPDIQQVRDKQLWCLMFTHTDELQQQLGQAQTPAKKDQQKTKKQPPGKRK
jgi:hypothetical protein